MHAHAIKPQRQRISGKVTGWLLQVKAAPCVLIAQRGISDESSRGVFSQLSGERLGVSPPSHLNRTINTDFSSTHDAV
jgi:hypothetical protein